MQSRFRPLSLLWIAILLSALAFQFWTTRARIARVEAITAIAREEIPTDADSVSGYHGDRRQLIIPERNNDTYHWIVQTQQMLATGEARIRHVDYDNAPFGRPVHFASPYRWWLGAIAWFDHQLTGRPIGLSVDRAALLADPLLHALLLIVVTIVVARTFGSPAASSVALALACSFPLAAGFLPGVPDHHTLAVVCAVASILPLVLGLRHAALGDSRAAQRAFVLGGISGGVGLWVGVSSHWPVLVGIIVGALLAAWVARPAPKNPGTALPLPPWRAWAVGGALSVLAAHLIEYFPDHLGSWRLEIVHPVFGLAWLGAGELLARAVRWIQRRELRTSARDLAIVALAVLATASVPLVPLLKSGTEYPAADPLASRLTNLLDGAFAENFATWLMREGLSTPTTAILASIFLFAAGAALTLVRSTDLRFRLPLAFALGPIALALAFSFARLWWWNIFGAALVALLALVTAAIHAGAKPVRRLSWWTALVAAFALSLAPLLPRHVKDQNHVLTLMEVEGLIERDLAHWLAKRRPADEIVVLAPPSVTTTLSFYGGFRGLATFRWENKDGMAAAGRIVSAYSPDEALALVEQRGVTHIIVPTWDPFLDELARLGAAHPQNTFVAGLKRWAQPLWLRPIPFELPAIAGFEGQSVVIFEVVPLQSEVLALSRQAEYFIEVGQPQLAAEVARSLARFQSDIGALVARAQVAVATGDASAHASVFDPLVGLVTAGADRHLAFDRRVSLAIALAQGKRADLSRAQLERCLADLNEPRLRSLTTASLYRLLVLANAFELEISAPSLRALAHDLLPAALRQRLVQSTEAR